jgi:Rrf2 family protein
MLSKKTRYAIIALIRLAKDYSKGPIFINDIANSEKIPRRFLENILLELKNFGLLGSKLGKNGGYYLLKEPQNVNLADVVRHFEGTIAMLYCVSEKSYQPCEFCKNENDCKIKTVFKDIRDYTFNVLKATTLSDLIKSS